MPSPPLKPWLVGLPLVALGITGLVATNPDPETFEHFAGDRLAAMAAEELCNEKGLPMMIRLVITDCHGLVMAQRGVLGQLARAQSRRRNFGIGSLYSTEIGGQRLMPGWRLPRYAVSTLGIAGHFWVLEAGVVRPSDREPAPGEAPPSGERP
ncbi:MAG: DUF4359 domain-containing protein [Synechococcus sp.]|nr:DUF4359 domain-containing protein [Synechococcus sp.]